MMEFRYATSPIIDLNLDASIGGGMPTGSDEERRNTNGMHVRLREAKRKESFSPGF